MSTVLIVGSSRGLGLALVKHCAQLARISLVLAAARSYSPALAEAIQQAPKRAAIVFIPLDVCDESSVLKSLEHVPAEVHDRGVDVLINCAGVSATTNGKVAAMYVRKQADACVGETQTSSLMMA